MQDKKDDGCKVGMIAEINPNKSFDEIENEMGNNPIGALENMRIIYIDDAILPKLL